MAARPETTWRRLDAAFQNYLRFIGRKQNRNKLSLLDLLHVSNFKGGNASITSTEKEVDKRLKVYSDVLRQIAEEFDDRALATLDDHETNALVSQCKQLLGLTRSNSTSIEGFGPSYASALLAAHFPALVPVLDRRIVNGLGLKAEWTSQRQIKRIETHYPNVIRSFRKRLRAGEADNLRDLDRVLFVVPLPDHKEKRPRRPSFSGKSSAK